MTSQIIDQIWGIETAEKVPEKKIHANALNKNNIHISYCLFGLFFRHYNRYIMLNNLHSVLGTNSIIIEFRA